MLQGKNSISPEEFDQFECLLGELLKEANGFEQENILLLHHRLKQIYEVQYSEIKTLEYLQSLAS